MGGDDIQKGSRMMAMLNFDDWHPEAKAEAYKHLHAHNIRMKQAIANYEAVYVATPADGTVVFDGQLHGSPFVIDECRIEPGNVSFGGDGVAIVNMELHPCRVYTNLVDGGYVCMVDIVATPADGDDMTWDENFSWEPIGTANRQIHSERTQEESTQPWEENIMERLARLEMMDADKTTLLHEQRAEITGLKRELARLARTIEQWRADD